MRRPGRQAAGRLAHDEAGGQVRMAQLQAHVPQAQASRHQSVHRRHRLLRLLRPGRGRAPLVAQVEDQREEREAHALQQAHAHSNARSSTCLSLNTFY